MSKLKAMLEEALGAVAKSGAKCMMIAGKGNPFEDDDDSHEERPTKVVKTHKLRPEWKSSLKKFKDQCDAAKDNLDKTKISVLKMKRFGDAFWGQIDEDLDTYDKKHRIATNEAGEEVIEEYEYTDEE